MIDNFRDALELGLLIVMSISPAIFLLCIAEKQVHKIIAVILFVISLTGFIGLKYMHDALPPAQVNHLYNYGETTE